MMGNIVQYMKAAYAWDRRCIVYASGCVDVDGAGDGDVHA